MKKFIIESYRVKRNRPLSFIINWLGMSLSFTAIIIMYLYLVSQFRHDSAYSRDMSNVYRLEISEAYSPSMGPLGTYIKGQIPEVEATAKFNLQKTTISLGEGEQAMVAMAMYGDSTLLDVLPFTLINGTQSEALATKDRVLVSRKTAMSLYGTTDIVGRKLRKQNKLDLTVSGVFEDMGDNAAYDPEVIVNINILLDMFGAAPDFFDNWGRVMYETCIRINPNADPELVRQKYIEITSKKLEVEWGMQALPEEMKLGVFKMRPFEDIYFTTEAQGFSANTDPDNLMVLALVALLVLVIGIVNYINIYVSRSTEVIRTMGIKSIMGASRSRLVNWVLFDSILIALLSALFALLIAWILEPYYNDIIGVNLPFALDWIAILVLLVGLPILSGVLSGLFPAVFLTRNKPLDAISNKAAGNRKLSWLRNSLVVLQFTISIALISATLIINRQINFVNSMDLGYNKENVVMLRGGTFVLDKLDTFRSELASNPDIVAVSAMKDFVGELGEFEGVNLDGKDNNISVGIIWGDEYSFRVMGYKMVEGDSLSTANVHTLQSGQCIVNETLAALYHTANPGKRITDDPKYIGICKDFHSRSLYMPLSPLVITSIYLNSYGLANIYIRLSGSNQEQALKDIERTFRKVYPSEVYEIKFFDQMYNMMYVKDTNFRKRLVGFSVLAVVIACLGLFSLVGYSVEQRRKEIALRRINGATVTQIVTMLCVSFLRWLLVAFVITIPIVWYVMNRWIEQYIYHEPIAWWSFAIALFITLLVAAVTILGQSYSAATINPARSIRS